MAELSGVDGSALVPLKTDRRRGALMGLTIANVLSWPLMVYVASSQTTVAVASWLALVLAAATSVWVASHLWRRHQALHKLMTRLGVDPAERGWCSMNSVADRVGLQVERQLRDLQSIVSNLHGVTYRHAVPDTTGEQDLARLAPTVAYGSDVEAYFGDMNGDVSGFVMRIDERFRAHVVREKELCLERRQAWNLEYPVRMLDGREVWIQDRGRFTYDEAGNAQFCDGRLIDITQRMESEQRIAWLSAAMESSGSELVIASAADFTVRYANRTAANIAGFRGAATGTTSLLALVPETERAAIHAALRSMIDNGDSNLRLSTRHCRRDGGTYPVEWVITRTEIEGGDELVLVAVDVSQRQAQEQALRESQQRLQLVLDASQDGIWDIHYVSGEHYLSDRGREILGHSAQPTAHNAVDMFRAHMHPDDQPRWLAALQRLEAGDETFETEARICAVSGAYRWVHLRGMLKRNAGGESVRMVGTLTNITQRKLADTAMQDAVSRLTAILTHVSEGIMMLDSDGRVRSFNPAAERIFGVDLTAILNVPVTELLPLDLADSDSWETALKANMTNAACFGRHADGSQFPVEVSLTPMLVSKQVMYTLCVRDISERLRFEEELIVAKERAEEAARAKGEFLAIVTHEMRTPLNGVLGMAQLLLDMDLNAEQEDTARMLLRSGESLKYVINDILDFSKLEAGKLEVETVPFDLRECLSDVMQLLAPRAQEKSLELLIDCPPDVPRYVLGDPVRVRQVLLNLVGNAVKFTERGHVLLGARCAQRMGQHMQCELFVEDTGVGIDTSAHGRLFKAFSQADATTTRRFGGTGLGLAISKKLVELMSGQISCESRLGVGSTFRVRLTLLLDPQQQDNGTVSGEGRRVHVLDPYTRGAELLCRDLRLLGFEAKRVPTIDEGLAANDALLLVDHSVVSGDLDWLTIELDKIYGLARIMVLLPSTRIVDRRAFLQRGFGDVLPKPVTLDALCARLGQVCASPTPDVTDTDWHSNLRVLLAEDNLTNQRVAVRMLERLGCEVDVASDGAEAVRMWAAGDYAAVFMDVHMPEVDGLTATVAIRADERDHDRARTPIVAMTALTSEDDEGRCIRAGMDEFISKPIRREQLADVLARWLAPGIHSAARQSTQAADRSARGGALT